MVRTIELSDKEPTSYKTLGLHVAHSLRMMPSNDLMSFFLGLVNRALVHVYLRPDFVHISAWNHILASSQPYLQDFESPLASASIACRELILGGCFTFHPRFLHLRIVYNPTYLALGLISLVFSSSFQLYLLCLLLCSNPRARSDPNSESEPRPGDARLILFIFILLRFLFQKLSRPESLA